MKKINEKLQGEWFEGQWIISGADADVAEYINTLADSGVVCDVTKNSFRTTAAYNHHAAKMAGFLRANGAEALADVILSSPPCTAPDLETMTLRDKALGFLYGGLIGFGNCDKQPEWEEALQQSASELGGLVEQFKVSPEELIAEMDRIRPNLVY